MSMTVCGVCTVIGGGCAEDDGGCVELSGGNSVFGLRLFGGAMEKMVVKGDAVD